MMRAARRPDHSEPRRTRAGRAWVGLAVAAVVLIALIIFIAENGQRVGVSFFGATGHIALAVALLIAAVAGCVITLLVGSVRILQLRRTARHLSAPPQAASTPPAGGSPDPVDAPAQPLPSPDR